MSVMNSSSYFCINSPHVVQEVFDEEVVIVNLDLGRYYCLQGSGVEFWKLLSNGHSLGGIARILSATHAATPDEIERAGATLLSELSEQGLIVPAPAQPASDDLGGSLPNSAGNRKPFVLPKLQVYDDMQDLLLLDPIHEVDEAGWPVAKKPAAVKAG